MVDGAFLLEPMWLLTASANSVLALGGAIGSVSAFGLLWHSEDHRGCVCCVYGMCGCYMVFIGSMMRQVKGLALDKTA
ncbi:hypothetical protein BDW60DRAFT_183513 [Aspergillus nidulans var. acristatus]